MIPILTSDSYRGFSTNLPSSGLNGVQPVFVGRLIWPGESTAKDAVMKLYEVETCGVANEVIGFVANKMRGVPQPKQAAIVLLSPEILAGISAGLSKFVDKETGLIACWATTLEQNTKPFKFVRRLSTFSEKQIKAFYKSKFCRVLSSVDHVTGNNDRHEGNFLYIDDLNYLAIDQGCVGGGLYWHKTWPDSSPKNTLLESVRSELNKSDSAAWIGEAILDHVKTQEIWPAINEQLGSEIKSLLNDESAETIVEYMLERASGSTFTTSCGRLI